MASDSVIGLDIATTFSLNNEKIVKRHTFGTFINFFYVVVVYKKIVQKESFMFKKAN